MVPVKVGKLYVYITPITLINTPIMGVLTCYFNGKLFTYLTFFSSIMGGLFLCALSPMRDPVRALEVMGKTSPVASSRGRLSIKDLSAWSTRLEF